MAHEIAFDEAGNTGADLLNPEQPVFALASVSLSRSEADEILASICTHQTSELKFTRLKRSEPGRRRIIELLSSPRLTKDNVRSTFVHKRFMVVAKIVDLLFETLVHDDGGDLYKRGANIAISNLHFICMPVACGKDWTETFLRRFVEMVRQPTPNNVRRFYDAARVLYERSRIRDYAEMILDQILASERMIGFILAHNDKNSLDPAFTALVRHCIFWGESLGKSIDLVHDESKSILKQKKLLESIMSRGEEEHLIGYDRRKFIFPLRARGIQFGRSEEDPRLQVADLVAGACAQWMAGVASPPSNQDFWEQLDAADIRRFELDALWPTSNMTPRELGTEYTGGVNAAEHIAGFLRKNRG